MPQVFVGVTPRHLASGRPLAFGDVVDDKDLTAEDEALREQLRPAPDTKATGPSDTTEDK